MSHRTRLAVVLALFLLALSACVAQPAPPVALPITYVREPVVAQKAAVPPPAVPPTELEAPVAPTPEPTPAPPPAPTPTGVLAIPDASFLARHTETISPDADGVVMPTSRDGLALVVADDIAATVYAVHSGGRAGAGPGGVLTVPDPERWVGAVASLPDGGAAIVTDAWVSDKDTTSARLAPAFADPAAVVLVTCQVEARASALSNVVVVLRRL